MADDPKVPFARSRDIVDAANLPFTPATLANWTGSADPGSTKAALDQLAARIVAGITTAPFQVPTVADAAALAALTASEGDIAWQADTNVLYVYTGAAWTAVITAAALGTAPFQVPTVADAAALAALTASEGDLVWQADTDVMYVYTGVTWLAVLQSTDLNALNTFRTRARLITVSAAAEAAEAINVTVAVTDGAGTAVSGERVRVYISTDPEGLIAVNAAAFVVADAGDGSIEDSDAGAAVWICLLGGIATSTVVLSVTDQAATGDTLYVWVKMLADGTTPVFSSEVRKSITFAA